MILDKRQRNNSFIFQAIIIIVFGVLGCFSVAQQVENTDAEQGYWANLYQSTIRYTVMLAENPFDLDVYFDPKGSVSTNLGYQGSWWVKGDSGEQLFCYEIKSNQREPSILSECFPLILMNNPRIGARWPSKFDQNIMYMAVVVEGRPQR
ncbi:uncharacterized protein METZ01_LOCUS44609 [marine metagenome]|uniref:Uncharacterized protein n=1 Tax=marine metagenome TaxID=408172 RepID=A0A381RIW5_9ZZZZ